MRWMDRCVMDVWVMDGWVDEWIDKRLMAVGGCVDGLNMVD